MIFIVDRTPKKILGKYKKNKYFLIYSTFLSLYSHFPFLLKEVFSHINVFSSYQTLVLSLLSFDKLESDEKKLNFNAVYELLLITNFSLPIKLTVCSIILPDPVLICAPDFIIS